MTDQDLEQLYSGKTDDEIADELRACIECRDWHGADLAAAELERRHPIENAPTTKRAKITER